MSASPAEKSMFRPPGVPVTEGGLTGGDYQPLESVPDSPLLARVEAAHS